MKRLKLEKLIEKYKNNSDRIKVVFGRVKIYNQELQLAKSKMKDLPINIITDVLRINIKKHLELMFIDSMKSKELMFAPFDIESNRLNYLARWIENLHRIVKTVNRQIIDDNAILHFKSFCENIKRDKKNWVLVFNTLNKHNLIEKVCYRHFVENISEIEKKEFNLDVFKCWSENENKAELFRIIYASMLMQTIAVLHWGPKGMDLIQCGSMENLTIEKKPYLLEGYMNWMILIGLMIICDLESKNYYFLLTMSDMIKEIAIIKSGIEDVCQEIKSLNQKICNLEKENYRLKDLINNPESFDDLFLLRDYKMINSEILNAFFTSDCRIDEEYWVKTWTMYFYADAIESLENNGADAIESLENNGLENWYDVLIQVSNKDIRAKDIKSICTNLKLDFNSRNLLNYFNQLFRLSDAEYVENSEKSLIEQINDQPTSVFKSFLEDPVLREHFRRSISHWGYEYLGMYIESDLEILLKKRNIWIFGKRIHFGITT